MACAAGCGAHRASAVAEEGRRCLSRAELARVAGRPHSPNEEQAMTKLDLKLRRVVRDTEKAAQQQARAARGAAAAREPADADVPCVEAEVEVTVYYTGRLEDLLAAGLQLEWRDRNDRGIWFASGRIAPSRLTEIAAIEHVIQVTAPGKSMPELNDSVPAIGVKALRQAHAGATGAGVIVAIVDTGFDWRHGSFRDDATGRTRVIAIWDLQVGARVGSEVGFAVRDPKDPTKRLPALGVYYERDDIDFSLGYQVTKAQPVKVRTTDPPAPFDPKKARDPSGHGTHVGGIAAGDGSPRPCCRPWGSGRFQGVAPGADILVVRAAATDQQVPRALSFIDEIAGGKPVVVNVSSGFNEGPHDGTSEAEKAIDSFVARPGRHFVKSAGNEGSTKKHGRVVVPAQKAGPPPAPGTADLEVVIPADMKAEDDMQLWYTQAASLEVQVVADGRASGWLGVAGNLSFHVDTQNPPTTVNLAATASAPQNGDRTIALGSTKHTGSSPLNFTLRFRNAGASAVTVDGWIAKGAGMTFASPTVEGTLTTPGTALGAITVANHTLGSSSCDSGSGIHETSSRGPARVAPADPAAAKPTLAAPGTGIASAKPDGACKCCPEWLEDHYQTLSGTSMAAPHVAGAIALMLQKNPTLTATQVRDFLREKAKPTGGPVNEWGAGKLDAQAAWERVPAPAPAPAPAIAFASRGLAEAAPALVPASPLHPVLHALRDSVRRLPDGELCAALVSRHFSEVRRLINGNRKVAAMWHRADGPHLLRRLAAGAVEAEAPAPLRGDRDRAYLVRMLEQLRRHGSAPLRASIDRHQSLVLRMVATPLAAQLSRT